jgi:lipopolysaccharide biosynthesis glycosyltransferase
LDAGYFNAGVLLIDAKRWRELDITNACMRCASHHSARLASHDQSLLNFVFYKDNFCRIEPKYNRALYPDTGRIEGPAVGIYHFVGSPKPWDILGELLHGNSAVFGRYLAMTHFRGYRSYADVTLTRLKRSARLSRSYLKSAVSLARRPIFSRD